MIWTHNSSRATITRLVALSTYVVWQMGSQGLHGQEGNWRDTLGQLDKCLHPDLNRGEELGTFVAQPIVRGPPVLFP